MVGGLCPGPVPPRRRPLLLPARHPGHPRRRRAEAAHLAGPAGAHIHGQVLVGAVVAGIAAYLSVRCLARYFETRTLTPFAIYCLVAGVLCMVRFT